MPKSHHSKDKMHLTALEWQYEGGGHKEKAKNQLRKLPFNYCALTLQPFSMPVCTKDGIIFDLLAIIPFIKQYGVHPVTGQKLEAKQLIQLTFAKNASGEYHCPVTFKVFNENSHIVALANTGNVFSWDAVEQLNVKAKNWKDLLTEEPFTRADIITLQNPSDLANRNVDNFHYLKHNLKVTEVSTENPLVSNIRVSSATSSVLDELYKTMGEEDKKRAAKEKEKLDLARKQAEDNGDEYAEFVPQVSAKFSNSAMAPSFTSTSLSRTTTNQAALVDRNALRYAAVKKKAYLTLATSLGKINLELHADIVPKTCENFVRLVTKGYYNGTVFHRNIKNFMIQGGDPTGTGRGGESSWGKPFEDEFRSNLSHEARGVLSMANSGPNTNGSQFFITFKSCRHLDKKHTVFGKVVGGMDTLTAMENVPVDKNDTPLEPITIVSAQVFVDPFKEADETLKAQYLQQKETAAKGGKLAVAPAPAKQKEEDDDLSNRPALNPSFSARAGSASSASGVGRYLSNAASSSSSSSSSSVLPTGIVLPQKRAGDELFGEAKRSLPPSRPGNKFGDFSSW